MYDDETAAHATWFIPAAHYLEAWGDARAIHGTVSLVQPLIEPLHGGRTCAEVLGMFLGERVGARDLLSSFWTKRAPERAPGPLTDQTNVGSPEVPGGTLRVSAFTARGLFDVAHRADDRRRLRARAPRRDDRSERSCAVDAAPRLEAIAGVLESSPTPAASSGPRSSSSRSRRTLGSAAASARTTHGSSSRPIRDE